MAWIVVAVGAALGARTLGGPSAGWAALLAVAIMGAVLGWRARRRSRAEDAVLVMDRRRGGPKPAFRGLYAFEPGERLPGEARAKVGRFYADWLMEGDPPFRLMCAESGCGKTSLVRTELWARLNEGGFEVRYFDGRSPGRDDPWLAVLDEMDALPAGARAVFILDQFERFFAAEPGQEARAEFGARVQAALSRCPGLRVLCIVPATHMLHAAELAPGLDDPTSKRSLLPLKHFATAEAEEVILECGRRDGLEVPPELAASLAQELSEDGRVRPTELQIVCTFLGRSFTEERYRKAGGAGGILAQHVRRALSKAEPGVVGARMLRAMCDFGEYTRGRPLTVGELVVEAAGKPNAENLEVVRRILAHFMDARIVLRAEGDDDRYELVHDYLVQAVAVATNTAATRRETANQQLDYYLRSDEHAIPFRRALGIRKFADPALRSTARARRLIWTSLLLPPLQWGSAAVLLSALVAAAFVARVAPTWREEQVGAQPTRLGVVFGARSYAGPRRIFSGDTESPTTEVRDSAGDLLTAVTGTWRRISPSGRWFIVQRRVQGAPDSTAFFAVDLTTRRSRPIRSTLVDKLAFASDSVVTYLDWQPDSAGGGHREFVVFLLPRMAVVGRVRAVPDGVVEALDGMRDGPTDPGLAFVSASLTRLVVPSTDGGTTRPLLYDIATGQLIAGLRDVGDEGAVRFTVDERRRRVLTAARSANGSLALRWWSLDSGERLGSEGRIGRATADDLDTLASVVLSRDGSEVLVTGRYRGVVLRSSDLSAPKGVRLNRRSASGLTQVPTWSEDGATTVLDLVNGGDRRQIRTATEPRDEVAPSADGRRVIVMRQDRRVELWAPGTDRPVGVLRVAGETTDALWSQDSTAVLVQQKRNLASVFDAETGELLNASLSKSATIIASTYSRACRRLTVWYGDGKVMQWTEGRWVFGRFWPAHRCKPWFGSS